MDIKIVSNGENLHLEGENGVIDMIPFKGSVDCELFKGIVEPCGAGHSGAQRCHGAPHECPVYAHRQGQGRTGRSYLH